jgi:hypothetical protein
MLSVMANVVTCLDALANEVELTFRRYAARDISPEHAALRSKQLQEQLRAEMEAREERQKQEKHQQEIDEYDRKILDENSGVAAQRRRDSERLAAEQRMAERAMAVEMRRRADEWAKAEHDKERQRAQKKVAAKKKAAQKPKPELICSVCGERATCVYNEFPLCTDCYEAGMERRRQRVDILLPKGVKWRTEAEYAADWVRQMLNDRYSCGCCRVGTPSSQYSVDDHPLSHHHSWDDHVKLHEELIGELD